MSTTTTSTSRTAVLARRIGQVHNWGQNGQKQTTIFYDIPIIPSRPLRQGLLVDIHELGPYEGIGNGRRPCYTVQERGMRGRIDGIRAADEKIVELVVVSDEDSAQEITAHLTIANIQGETVELPTWRRLLQYIMKPITPTTRSIELERNVTLLRTLPQSEEERQWEDARDGAHEEGDDYEEGSEGQAEDTEMERQRRRRERQRRDHENGLRALRECGWL